MAIYVPWLVDAARLAVAGTGKQVIVQPGWQTRGHGGMRVLEGVVGHHTGTPESAPGDYPSLNVMTYGHSTLAGPLAHYGLGRLGNIYVVAAGLCYHAGASAFGGFYDLNDEFIGIEAEQSGNGAWTAAQLEIYPRLVGAILTYIRRGVDRYASHRTVAVPAGRKPDPGSWPDADMRASAAAFLRGELPITPPPPAPEEDEDMRHRDGDLAPATDPANPGWKFLAMPPVKDSGYDSADICRLWITTGNGNEVSYRVWFVAMNGNYLGSGGNVGIALTARSDKPGWLPVPDGTAQISIQYTTKLDRPAGYLVENVKL